MTLLFLGLMLANFIFLIAAAVVGYRGMAHWHFLIGALAAIVSTAVHCIVFTYFIATGKWIEHAIALKQLDPGLMQRTRVFKRMAFPAALGGMTLAISTAIVGGAVDNHYLAPAWHHVMAMMLLGGNVVIAVIEYRAIRDNGVLIDGILEEIKARS
jgi:hypothetical protein